MSLSAYIKERAGSSAVYMPYLTLGDPSYDESVQFALSMIDAGADLLELGIPFSDPTADGPVIQKAMVRSLEGEGFNMQKVFAAAKAIHAARPGVPLVFLTYMNPIMNGLDGSAGRVDFSQAPADRLDYDSAGAIRAFLAACQDAGIQGVVIPELPFDQPESVLLRELAPEYNVEQILMVAPNTGPDRLEAVCKAAGGFIYYVTSLGVTGMRSELPPELGERVRLVRETSGLPVLAGFGISRPEQVPPLREIVDGIIVGSLNHRIIEEAGAGAGEQLARLTGDFARACHGD